MRERATGGDHWGTYEMLRLNLSGQGVLVDLPQSSDQFVPAGIRVHVQPRLCKVLLSIFPFILVSNIIEDLQ